MWRLQIRRSIRFEAQFGHVLLEFLAGAQLFDGQADFRGGTHLLAVRETWRSRRLRSCIGALPGKKYFKKKLKTFKPFFMNLCLRTARFIGIFVCAEFCAIAN